MKQKRIFATALILICAFSGCISSAPIYPNVEGSPAALGEFTLSSSKFEQHSFTLTSCISGTEQEFLGVDFFDVHGVVVRLVEDPLQGPAVRVFSIADPLRKSAVFLNTECTTFIYSLVATDWRVNHSYDYRVALDLDCSNSKGDRLTGRASSTHCH